MHRQIGIVSNESIDTESPENVALFGKIETSQRVFCERTLVQSFTKCCYEINVLVVESRGASPPILHDVGMGLIESLPDPT